MEVRRKLLRFMLVAEDFPSRRLLCAAAVVALCLPGSGGAIDGIAVDLTPLGPEGTLQLPTQLVHTATFLPRPQRGEGFVLLDGTNALTIVTVNKKVRKGLWTLAEELRYHLEKMSGQTVALVEPTNRPATGRVVVLGADDGTVPEGTSIVRRNGPDELYIGGEGAGISHALTYVLEALGCRYLFPGKAGKVIPRKARVVLPDFELNYTPPLKVRIVRNPTVGNSAVNAALEELGIVPAEFSAAQKAACSDHSGNRGFWAWHGVGDSTIVATDTPAYADVVRAGHHFTNYWELYGETHPEWFSLQGDGSREQTSSRPRLCTSNKELRDNIVQECVGRLDANPEMQGISICMPDGGYDSVCFCEECRKLDPPNGRPHTSAFYRPSKVSYDYVSLTDRMVDFSNYIQAEVRKLRPGKHLVQFAYSNYANPPVLNLPDPDLVFFNVAGSYINAANYLGAQRNMAGWLSLGNQIVWRPNCLKGFECPYPMNFARHLFDDVEAFKTNGVVGVTFDCGNAEYSSRGFMFYMLAKSILNPDRLSYDDIADDWLETGFGSAAECVANYLKELERVFHAAARRAIGSRGYQEAFDADYAASLLDEAAMRCGGDSNVLERIDYLRVGIGHARASKKVYQGWASGEWAKLYAARNEYLAWIAQEAFDHPFEFPHDCPYMAGDPYSASDGVLYDMGKPGDLVLTDDRTIYVPEGMTNRYNNLTGAAFTLTKTGGGVLQVGRVDGTEISVVVREGEFNVANWRPACFTNAFFHVDASAADTLVTECRGGTNFVTRWNDVDGRAEVYATPSLLTKFGRTDPTNRLPFVGQGTQNGLAYVDFGTLAVPNYTNAAGVALGHGACLQWAQPCAEMREGFTVLSDTPDIDTFLDVCQTGYCPMSFFSCVSSHAGFRGSFKSGSRPNFYQDTSYNYPFTRGTNYLNGTVTSWKRSFPAGFQLIGVRPSEAVKLDAFGGAYRYSNGAKYMFGGTRIAEYCVFTNELSETDRADVTRYLRAKWFPQALASVTVKGEAQFTADPGLSVDIRRYVEKRWVPEDLVLTGDVEIFVEEDEVRLIDCVGGSGAYTITKTGPGLLRIRQVANAAAKLHVAEGTVGFYNSQPLCTLKAWFALDPNAASTLETERVGGVEYVNRVKDANGGEVCAANDSTETTLRTDPENRRVFVGRKAKNGQDVLDFGFLLMHKFTNETALAQAYGGALRLDRRCTQVREVVQVFADRPEVREAVEKYGVPPTTYSGPSLVCDTSDYPGTRVRMGEGYISLYYDNNKNNEYRHADTWLNGTSVTNKSSWWKNVDMPAGLNVLDSQTTDNVGLTGFGHGYKRDSGDPYGGILLGEFYCFTNLLEEADRLDLNRYLCVKWRENGFAEVTLDKDTVLTVDSGVYAYADVLNVAGAGSIVGEGVFRPKRIEGVTNALTAVDGSFVWPADASRALPPIDFPTGGELKTEATNFVERLSARGALTKTGGGALYVSDLGEDVASLTVAEGTFCLDPLMTMQADAHFDASATDSLSVVSENGTNFVTRWQDVGPGETVAEDITTVNGYRLEDRRHSPYLNAGIAANGRPLMDFGYLMVSAYTNETAKALAHGGGMDWNRASVCQEVLSVMGDRPEVATAAVQFPEVADGKVGPSYLAHGSGKYYFCRRGKLMDGYAWLASDNGNNNKVKLSGTLLRDGVATRGIKVMQTAGLHVMDWRFSATNSLSIPAEATINAFAHTGYDPGTWGGLYIGEYITFPKRLSEADRARFYEALRVKWFGAARPTRTIASLAVAKGTSFALPWHNLAVTGTLTLEGRVTCPEVSANRIEANGGMVAGRLELQSDSELVFRQTGENLTSLTATNVQLGDGMVTITVLLAEPKLLRDRKFKVIAADVSGFDLSRVRIRVENGSAWPQLTVKADGVYVAFGNPGAALIVR